MKTLKNFKAPYRTVSGAYVDLAHPERETRETIRIQDIASHLSKINRFNGATEKTYTVGQHCLFMTQFFINAVTPDTPQRKALIDLMRGTQFYHWILELSVGEGSRDERRAAAYDLLMHDATEAYLGDMTSPLKALMPEYKALEARWDARIRSLYNQAENSHPIVKRLDVIALEVERTLFKSPDPDDMDTAHLWPVLSHEEQALAEWLVESQEVQALARLPRDVIANRFIDLHFALGCNDLAVYKEGEKGDHYSKNNPYS